MYGPLGPFWFRGSSKLCVFRYCDRNWNTENCYTIDLAEGCNPNGTLVGDYTYWRQECTPKETYCQGHDFEGYELLSDVDFCVNYTTSGELDLIKKLKTVVEDNGISPAEDYFNGKVLGLNKDYEGKAESRWTELQMQTRSSPAIAFEVSH